MFQNFNFVLSVEAKMPKGPELYLASVFVNKVCKGRIFSGNVIKSAVSVKNPDVPWNKDNYNISATSRGKEIRLTLTQMHDMNTNRKLAKMHIIFRFGMSGKFRFDTPDSLHKHAHLNFYSKCGKHVLSYVDQRRFGRWEVDGVWGKDRGPCVIQECAAFR